MLGGAEVTLLNSFMIAITGMAIVMLELGFLYLLVVGLAKIVRRIDEVTKIYNAGKDSILQKGKKVEIPVAKKEEATTENYDDVLAIIAVGIAAETGLSTEEFIIKSVEVR